MRALGSRHGTVLLVALGLLLGNVAAADATLPYFHTVSGDAYSAAQGCRATKHAVYHTVTMVCSASQQGTLTYLLPHDYRYHVSAQTTGDAPTVTFQVLTSGPVEVVVSVRANQHVTVHRVQGTLHHFGP